MGESAYMDVTERKSVRSKKGMKETTAFTKDECAERWNEREGGM